MVNSQRPPGENAPAPHMEMFGECRGKGKEILISKGHQYKDCTFFMTYHATAIYHRNMYIYIYQFILVLWLLRDRSILLLWVMFGELQSESF